MVDLMPNPQPERVLVVAAHPDDIEVMAGGTVASWTAAGSSVHYLLVTDGEAGSRDPHETPAALAARRRAEQRAAARLLDVASVAFLGYPDGRVEPTMELRLEIARMIRQVRPDVVLTLDPQFRYSASYINHPDHIAVGTATLAAIMPLANTRLAAAELAREGLEPHDVREVYLAAPETPSVWMPLRAAEIGRKLRAVRAHASQFATCDPEEVVYDWALMTASAARTRSVACEYAEAFAYIRLHPPMTGTARRQTMPVQQGRRPELVPLDEFKLSVQPRRFGTR